MSNTKPRPQSLARRVNDWLDLRDSPQWFFSATVRKEIDAPEERMQVTKALGLLVERGVLKSRVLNRDEQAFLRGRGHWIRGRAPKLFRKVFDLAD